MGYYITSYQIIFGDLDSEEVDAWMSKGFIQHNSTLSDGLEGVGERIVHYSMLLKGFGDFSKSMEAEA